MKSIYIFLTRTESITSKMVKFFTNDKYTHSAIAFDKELFYLYSSGRKNGIKITKDSFIIGALPEMRKQLSNTSADTVHALMKIKNENMLLSKKLVFTKARLRTKKYTSSVNDGKSFDIGKKFGAKIDIPKKIDIKILT